MGWHSGIDEISRKVSRNTNLTNKKDIYDNVYYRVIYHQRIYWESHQDYREYTCKIWPRQG